MLTAIIAAVVSALAILVAAVISATASRWRRLEVKGLKIEFQETADPTKDSRVDEARKEQRQESMALWNRRADGSLVFGQYIIGGVLASSFVRQSLSAQIVGILGVLVLLSSLIRQRYRPNVQAQGARRRVVSLRSLIRGAEDDLFALKNGHENAPSIYAIRQKVSLGLSKIEQDELLETGNDGSA